MALKVKQIETDYGAVFNDVYFKIDMIRYVDRTQMLTFMGVFYVSEDVRNNDSSKYIESENFTGTFLLEDKTVNMYEYTYNYIKERAEITYSQINVSSMSLDEDMVEIDDLDIDKRYLVFVGTEDC